MKNLYKIIQSITPGPDKLGHFFFGFVLMCLGSVIDLFINTWFMAYILPIVFGVGKELIDKNGYGQVEFLDIVFTISPCVILLI